MTLIYDRLQFAFTVGFHYLFPQLTMGLALFLALFQTSAIVRKDPLADRALRFWSKIFAIPFVFGVVTGIVLEFEFGTNWSSFSRFSGETVGQLLALEGTFAFFLESSFLGILLFGRKRVGKGLQLLAAWMVFLGTWLSGYFIILADAWMQHPVGFSVGPDGIAHLTSLRALLFNPWAFHQYAHNMAASVVTASFVVAAVGAFYLLSGLHREAASYFLRWGVILGLLSTLLVIFPTGDRESQQVFAWQPTKAAAMEGLFKTERGAPLILIGQPNLESESLDNPILVPKLLSFLTYHRFAADVKGLESFPRSDWPDNIPLVYYAYHIMVGLGTVFVAIMVTAGLLLPNRRLERTRWLLWAILLGAPFPYIATTAGWVTAEAGRQPWLVYSLLRTAHGASPGVNAGNALFTFLGFLGLYLFLGLLFALLLGKRILEGPPEEEAS
ncbi:cytochrome bd ubiquinol oxidase subunit I [Methylacidimicrobium cyclopophantes]|uniref:Cytochrome bd ubiquinol oxidase subunit I n=1 Tax=Methylacidimicrobium cyclopophantes TaxID=1041766 RepID=A0A5E6MAG8_9BACT|nr:cytochrome ubiquinol oxidase subunit I [Methylacidimicrobium cyclopophantes]VVM06199.1 cytochrome bd ubiquinol oxidase subunit I [Methylacidimicrobium cyclopophantes]